METKNENADNQQQAEKDNTSKPVGYGSSIQTDGYGNRTRPQTADVNPTSQQDHIQELKNEADATERMPKTDGTGSNREVHTDESLIIKKDEES